jgi:NAD(P)-dependent dehydrogenase (short-subunit alcohol dehydrogenase family)
MTESIVLTGGSGLIGSKLALHLAGKGYHVITIDKADGIETEGIDHIVFHLEDIEQYPLLMTKIMKLSSNIIGLINNAAINPMIENSAKAFGKFEDIGLQQWNEEIKINLSAPVFLTKQMLELFNFNSNRKCRIINMLSTYGIVPPNQNIYKDYSKKIGTDTYKPLSYAVSKAALGMVTRYLAVYLAERNITVNAIAPGGISNNQDESFVKAYTELTPMKKMGQVEDLMSAFEYLLSPGSDYMTGQTLIIDGGWTVW